METFEIIVKIGAGVGCVLALLSIGVLLASLAIRAVKMLMNDKYPLDD